MLLLHSVGAKSGLERINPMMFLPDGDRMIVIASKAGSPGNPDWYHNLKAHPDITVEVGTQTVRATAVELEGGERDRLFAEQARRYPGVSGLSGPHRTADPGARARATKAAVTAPTLRTERLLLRPWGDSDREPFAAMNSDARTMEHFPALWTRQQSDEFVDRAQAALERDGFGPWAVEVVGVAEFIGFVSLERVRQDLPFAPAIEVMWRFSAGYWGQGYASEAAVAAMKYGFEQCGFEEIVGFSSAANLASRRMNRRLQMVPDPAGDFEYPGLPGGHRLLRHVLYRARRDSWPGRALTGREWNQLVIDEFRAHDGQAGDTFEGSRLLLLTSTGARTGQPRTNPTMYLPDGGRYIIFATSGGRPHNPAWYHNLKAHPRARAEVGTDTFAVTAEEITGHERDRLYQRQAAADPSFAGYEKKTARQIPVIALHRIQ